MLKSLFVLSLAAACTRAAAPAPVAPSPSPSPSSAPPAPAAAPAPHRIQAGGWPGSNTHRWGSRSFELRETPAGVEVRIHDAISFQGSGMQPGDMPPTRHSCTPWELIQPPIAMPTITKCGDDSTTCEAIRAFYKATAKPPAPHDPTMVVMPDHTYSRGSVSCG